MSDENTEVPGKAGLTAEEVDAKIRQAAEGLKAKAGGSADLALLKILDENHGYRDKLRDAASEIIALKAKLPAEGTLVLDGDTRAEYDAYQALGKPEELRRAKKDGSAAIERLAGIDLADALKAIGRAGGLVPDVFADLARMKGLKPEDMEVKEEKGKDGKPVPKVFVKGEGESRTPIDQYAEKNWAAYLPALRAESKVDAPRQNGTPPPRHLNTPPPAPTGGENQDTRVLAAL